MTTTSSRSGRATWRSSTPEQLLAVGAGPALLGQLVAELVGEVEQRP
jgi:hypothetical protein